MLVMMAAHVVFMACLPGIYGGYDAGQWLDAVRAGQSMDRSVASYLTVIPALLTIASVWLLPRVTDRAMTVYYAVAAIVTAAAMTADTLLYSYWGMKLDTTPLFYLLSSPGLAMASAPWWQVLLGLAAWGGASALLFLLFRAVIRLTPLSSPTRIRRPGLVAATFLLLTAALFIPIRGGLTVSTTNLSSAYFSSDPRLNHAAVNPLFSFLYSATHNSGFDHTMRFMDPAEAERLAAPALAPERYESTGSDTLLTVERPDIVLVILESFSSSLLPVQGGENIAPRLDSIARSGLIFTQAYASGFRTDRAIPALLSGLPAPPTSPVMKHTAIAERLPGLPAALRRAGYHTIYYYGGDINFTNQRAYLRSAGIDSIVSDTDFPLALRASKWGVADGPLLARLLADEGARDDSAPHFTVVQTSSSHEPFDVGAFSRHDNRAANAFAYADSCVGAFVDSLALSPRWGRTLVVLVADHYGCYPTGLDERSRHHIPLVMTGGALGRRGTVDSPVGQNDLAATLLGALGLPAGDFPFSRDMLATPAPATVLFSEPDFAAALAPDGTMSRLPLTSGNTLPDTAPRPLGAYLQQLYTYLSSLNNPPSPR